MRLEPILRAHAYMNVEQPPELWEADTEDSRFLPLLGETIAAALANGALLEELTRATSRSPLKSDFALRGHTSRLTSRWLPL